MLLCTKYYVSAISTLSVMIIYMAPYLEQYYVAKNTCTFNHRPGNVICYTFNDFQDSYYKVC